MPLRLTCLTLGIQNKCVVLSVCLKSAKWEVILPDITDLLAK